MNDIGEQNRDLLVLSPGIAALDGLKFWRVFGILQPSQKDLAGLRRLLARIIEEA